MDLEMLLRLHHEQQIYMLNAKHIFETHIEMNQFGICDHLDHLKRLELIRIHHRNKTQKHITSFKIKDILSDEPRKRETRACKGVQTIMPNICNNVQRSESNARMQDNQITKRNIIRPWSKSPRVSPSPSVKTNLNNNDSISDEEIDVESFEDEVKETPNKLSVISPLDALMEMSNKAFKGLQTSDSSRTDDTGMMSKSHLPKKKRKTRTAFSNQQIYELEKRFLYQKYLTPADRDEIAGKLGLSCAQVITWFQNRRAKFKRDIEEMKSDVSSVRSDLTGEKSNNKHGRE